MNAVTVPLEWLSDDLSAIAEELKDVDLSEDQP